jgi:hypothetical protein
MKWLASLPSTLDHQGFSRVPVISRHNLDRFVVPEPSE